MTDLLDIRRIYVEPAAAALPRGREILARFPDAETNPLATQRQGRFRDQARQPADRIAAIDDFVAAGYEVHFNVSPVVVRALPHRRQGCYVAALTELIEARTPYCRIRYAC